MGVFQHPIQVVSRVTGLSPHVIRVWERRYRVVTPTRTGSNRRLYADDEVERLRLLAQATEAGHRIGHVATLSTEELKRLVSTLVAPPVSSTSANGAPGQMDRSDQDLGQPVALVRGALDATRQFDCEALDSVLRRGAMLFGHNGLLHRVVGPLACEIGESWQKGQITAAHEHFATAIIRNFLAQNSRPFAPSASAPKLVVATPAGQLHELGAVMAAAVATNLGWNAIYLGASLPPAEIGGAAIQNRVRAVVLSVVYPADDRQFESDLRQLRRYLPSEIEIIVGGRAARSYAGALKEVGAINPATLDDLYNLLEELRETRTGG